MIHDSFSKAIFMFLVAMNLLCKSCLLFGWAHSSVLLSYWAEVKWRTEKNFHIKDIFVFSFFFSPCSHLSDVFVAVSRMKWETYAMSCINYKALVVQLQKVFRRRQRRSMKMKWIRDFMKILNFQDLKSPLPVRIYTFVRLFSQHDIAFSSALNLPRKSIYFLIVYTYGASLVCRENPIKSWDGGEKFCKFHMCVVVVSKILEENLLNNFVKSLRHFKSISLLNKL